MILADKIIRLRKKNGWSQEDLANEMNVSRQAVSKWEGAQTIPDIEKILLLGRLFGVTTDYLLKDEIEEEEFSNDDSSDMTVKKISIEEANTYLEQRKRASWQIAIATFLCILSPITLILLCTVAENLSYGISQGFAAVVGLVIMFVFVLCAVPLYLYCGFKNEQYDFLDKNIPFVLEREAKGIVVEQQKRFRGMYIRWNIIASCCCIFSPIPLMLSAFTGNEILCVSMLAVMMIIAGVGASMFIVVGVQRASMQKLLQEGEYTEKEKRRSGVRESVDFAYWGVLTAIYLAWSFLSADWHISWVIFAIGGVLYPIVMAICNYIADKQNGE